MKQGHDDVKGRGDATYDIRKGHARPHRIYFKIGRTTLSRAIIVKLMGCLGNTIRICLNS